MKEIYERFSVISSKQVRLVSYAEHFIPFTIQWLDDCSIEYCKYVEKSYYIDEEEKFARDNEYVKFRIVLTISPWAFFVWVSTHLRCRCFTRNTVEKRKKSICDRFIRYAQSTWCKHF